MEHTLEIKGLTMSYGKRYVVKDVSLFVRRGEIVGLLGSNGAGKTTTFNMIVGMIRPEQGRIALDGKDISNLPMYKRARKGMGYLPQEPSIFMKLSVKENLKAVLEIRNTNGKIYNSLNEEVDRLIEEFNLSGFADRNGYKLSGGERRRAEIARAIALNPTFMLFDEPFTGIDPITISELKKMLTYLKSKGLGILITDHNVRETLSITDRAYIINDGSVLADGRPDELVSNPSVRESYLGEEFRL
ncbi:LPS export ABC transporter ATP-binding protein [Thermodesulfovibrionales bacterium]|nr:LPS export ABC transporter ATP-binding protein [Thermodesulfovibrionales bacterium]MCL0034178.1 LPS export ABC transporter ATP-binding protein [Thermodesulfovibrionales bacterium]MCL0035798.1 LPS export ABC transporter ATP-binding protein [Thermodesulfovibrionales bacterium]MCL0042075.1 LPS export ABC transporter ATP-binding protein [Thermodesulfovibrionales bacterium]MCL0049907.1 LPS export ABC transporter ATP-binding protein [Thermodesulfovibrionales bacterium]